jgi:hypothetical protein
MIVPLFLLSTVGHGSTCNRYTIHKNCKMLPKQKLLVYGVTRRIFIMIYISPKQANHDTRHDHRPSTNRAIAQQILELKLIVEISVSRVRLPVDNET